MTERYEVTSELQREFVNDREVFGTLEKGSAAEPAVRARSIHHVMKVVAGTSRCGVRHGSSTSTNTAKAWPTWARTSWTWCSGRLSRSAHRLPQGHRSARRAALAAPDDARSSSDGDRRGRVSGGAAGHVHDGVLDYYCNNSVAYTLRGVHVELEILWNWEAAGGRRRVRSRVPRHEIAASRSGRARPSASFRRCTSSGGGCGRGGGRRKEGGGAADALAGSARWRTGSEIRAW